MTDPVRTLLDAPLPVIVVIPWGGTSGWPTNRVYIDASAFDQDGQHFLEFDDRAEALAAARLLAGATGFAIEERD